jgi:transcriptional regulator with XRE-family HTH domain
MSGSPHPTDVQVGQRLRQRRAALGMSQERLGELLGVTYQQVQKYERGANRIGSSRLHALSRVLDVPVSYFFEDADPPPGPAPLPGLAEGATSFVFDGPLSPPAPEPAPAVAAGRETLELVRAFGRIADPLVRRHLLELARALAAVPYRGPARDTSDP